MDNKWILMFKEKLSNKLLIPSKAVLILLTSIFLFACGGGGDGGGSSSSPDDLPSLSASQPVLSFSSTKRFNFTWTDSESAEFYRLFENNDEGSGFVQIGSDIPQGEETVSIYVPLYKRMNARYILQTCNMSECLDSDEISVNGNLTASVGYIKSTNENDK